MYAGQLLYVLVLVLSKLSILFFLRTITPVSLHKLCIFYLSIFILAWGVSGLLATAFQCEAPEVWRFLARKQCIQRVHDSSSTQAAQKMLISAAGFQQLFLWLEHLTGDDPHHNSDCHRLELAAWTEAQGCDRRLFLHPDAVSYRRDS